MQRIIRTLTIFTFVLSAVTSCTSKRMLSKANATFDVGEYDRAAVYYRKSLKKVKDRNQRGYVMFRQGECYRLLNFNQFAVNSYRLAITFKYSDTTVYLRYGQVLYNVGRYKDSRDAIDTYLKAFPNSPLGVNYSTALDSVDYWKTAPSRYIVAKERAFDSRRSDFCPVYVGADYDVVYFNSTREGGVSVKNSNITGMRPADFYMTRKDSKNSWTAPELVPGDLNTDYDEGVASVTPDGKAMYFTVCRYENGKAYGASIYRAERTGAQWGKPNIVPVLTDSTSDSLIIAHPAINNGETELYFTSDLPGGFGGKDIWMVKKRGQKWGSPENLGPKINTPGDEVFPFLRSDGVLYFSSNGWPGMGGLDIFKAEWIDSAWVRTRMPAPVNSSGDDFGIVFQGDKERGMFSSNRNEPRGNDKIYSFELPELQFIIEGNVTDERDGSPLADAIIKLVGNDGTNTKIRTRKDGTFAQEINKGADFVFLVTARGYLNERGEASTIGLSENKNFNFNFKLSSIKKPIRLNNILFAFGKWDLNDLAMKSLDTLVTILNDNPNITIELGAHSDMIGDDKTNLELSKKRAQSVVDYLISKKIAADRLQSQGYGESQPFVADKNTADAYDFINEGDVLNPTFIMALTPEQQEVCNQINRRTEFKVLSTNYKPGK